MTGCVVSIMFGFFWQEPRQKNKERSGLKRKGFESEEDSPRKATTHAHRRMAVVYDSDEE